MWQLSTPDGPLGDYSTKQWLRNTKQKEFAVRPPIDMRFDQTNGSLVPNPSAPFLLSTRGRG